MKIEKKGNTHILHVHPEASEIKGTVYLKDKDGTILDSMEIKPLKIVRRIYFIFYTSGDFEQAARTRKREIEARDNEWSYIFIKQYEDLWEIKSFVDESIKKVKQNGWLKTTEVCFYSHGGTDGPVGEINTSKYNLADETGRKEWDSKQMSLDGWKQIDFNFDPDNSIAAFYGCKSINFAENFIDIQNVKYTVAHGGSSADSESFKEFDPSWFTFSGENIYYISPTDVNNSLAPVEIIKSGRRKWERSIENDKITTNVGLDPKGNIYGWGQNGEVKIRKENIKYLD